MNDLIITNSKEGFNWNSLQVAEWTGKLHSNIMRDIKDEIENLKNGGMENFGKFNFELSSYTSGSNFKKYKMYVMTTLGIRQLAMRYDATIRAKINLMIEKIENERLTVPTTKKELYLELAAKEDEIERKNIDYKNLADRYYHEIRQLQGGKGGLQAVNNRLQVKIEDLEKEVKTLTNNIKDDKEYTAYDIAKKFGVFSLKEKPHSAIINDMLLRLDKNYNREWKLSKSDLYKGYWFREINVKVDSGHVTKDYLYNQNAFNYFKNEGINVLHNCKYGSNKHYSFLVYNGLNKDYKFNLLGHSTKMDAVYKSLF